MSSEEYKALLQTLDVRPLSGISPGFEDVFCVVKRSYDLKQSLKGGKDWKISAYITDPTCSSTTYVTLLLFNPVKEELEKIKSNSIIILKRVKISSFQGKIQIQGNMKTRIAIFEADSVYPLETNFKDCSIDENDAKIINYLLQWNADLLASDELEVTLPPPRTRKLLTVEEIVSDSHPYMNFIGQVAKVLPAEECLQLILTDYTQNPLPASLEDYDSLNVGNNFLIMCSLWDDHVTRCPSLSVGDFVHLQNCKKKQEEFLELNIHGNSENKNYVIKLDSHDSRLEELIERKKHHITTTNTHKRRKLDQVETPFTLKSHVYVDIDKTTSIEKVLEEKEPKELFINGFIKGSKPDQVEDWVVGWCSHCQKSSIPDGNCSTCNKKTLNSFRLALAIEDNSGYTLFVDLHPEDAALLFSFISAEEIYKSEARMETFKKYIAEAVNNKVNFDFAIESYSVPGQNYFHYKIVDTSLIE